MSVMAMFMDMMASSPSITLAYTLPAATVGAAYTGSITATNVDGATGAITMTTPTLPAGLTLGTRTGSGDGPYTWPVTGTPTTDTTTTPVSTTYAVSNGTQSASYVQTWSIAAASSATYWSPTVKNAGITLSTTANSNDTATGTTSGWMSVRAVDGTSSGLIYFEGLVSARSQVSMFGFSDGTPTTTGYAASDAHGWQTYSGSGNKYHVGSSSSCLPAWGGLLNPVLMCAINRTLGMAWFGLNGTWVGDPVAGTGAAYTSLPSGLLYPVGSTNTVGAQLVLRMQNSDFSYTPPSGYSSPSGS